MTIVSEYDAMLEEGKPLLEYEMEAYPRLQEEESHWHCVNRVVLYLISKSGCQGKERSEMSDRLTKDLSEHAEYFKNWVMYD